jgi:chromosome segregation ATPase
MGEHHFDLPGAETAATTLATLRHVEAERDGLAERLNRAEKLLDQAEQQLDEALDRAEAAERECAELSAERDEALAALKQMSELRAEAIEAVRRVAGQRDLAHADLDAARAELEYLREDGEIRAAALVRVRAELTEARTAHDQVGLELAQARHRLAELQRAPGAVIGGHDGWACLTLGGCDRYVADEGPLAHHCGPLTRIRVTLSLHEGAPQA